MKKLSTYLFLILLSFSAPSFADDISEYEIEGISIGDSLLDHLSKEEIITEIEINKPAYNYLTEDFGEVYLFSKFEIYDVVSFFVKPNDKKYLIYYIGGTIYYDNNIKECYIKQKEIAQDFSQVFENSKKDGPHKMKHLDVDPSGESIYTDIYFEMDDNYSVIISCYDYSDHLESQNRVDFLGIVIRSQKFDKWLSKPTK